jgi:hypothetical protein
MGNSADYESLLIQGAVGQEALALVLERRVVDVKKGKGDDRKAGGTSSTGGAKKSR